MNNSITVIIRSMNPPTHLRTNVGHSPEDQQILSSLYHKVPINSEDAIWLVSWGIGKIFGKLKTNSLRKWLNAFKIHIKKTNHANIEKFFQEQFKKYESPKTVNTRDRDNSPRRLSVCYSASPV